MSTLSAEQGKELAKQVINDIGDLLEQQDLLKKDQSYYMIDALRWVSYQNWADDMPPAVAAKHTILAVAAGLNKYNADLPPMYAKGAMSKAKDLFEVYLQKQFGLSLSE